MKNKVKATLLMGDEIAIIDISETLVIFNKFTF
jgi:hypothetical protein